MVPQLVSKLYSIQRIERILNASESSKSSASVQLRVIVLQQRNEVRTGSCTQVN